MTLVAIHILLEANQQLKLTLTIQFSPTAFECTTFERTEFAPLDLRTRCRRSNARSNAPVGICEHNAGVHSAFERTVHSLHPRSQLRSQTVFELTPPVFERNLQQTYFNGN
jgi:hypothetical protein